MGKVRQVRGGGRAVEVSAERLAGWFERFAERNDGVERTRIEADTVTVTAGNGTTATVQVPFAPIGQTGSRPGLVVEPLVRHMRQPRTIGLLLVRLGGHSIGVAAQGKVVLSRTDRHLVHGRSAAGGWSQQRFARRRAGQARQALQAAADDAAEILGARIEELNAVVLGGDRRAIDELQADRRLSKVFALAEPRVLDIPEPRRTVLDDAAARTVAVEIVVVDAG
jgi:hypothetical protein